MKQFWNNQLRCTSQEIRRRLDSRHMRFGNRNEPDADSLTIEDSPPEHSGPPWLARHVRDAVLSDHEEAKHQGEPGAELLRAAEKPRHWGVIVGTDPLQCNNRTTCIRWSTTARMNSVQPGPRRLRPTPLLIPDPTWPVGTILRTEDHDPRGYRNAVTL
jgi:hypothetical protein